MNNDHIDENNDDDDITLAVTEIKDLPSPDNPKERKFCITFDNFRDLPSDRGQEVHSSVFTCFQTDFCVVMFPGDDYLVDEEEENGVNKDDDENKIVQIGIKRTCEGEALDFKFTVGIKCQSAKPSDTLCNTEIVYRGIFRFCSDDWGFPFEPRADMLTDYLEGGALKVYVTIQLKEYIPKNPTSKMILNLFCHQESKDIVFEVCDQQQHGTGKRKRANASSITYDAHRFILRHSSNELAALCATSEGLSPVIVNDVNPTVFHHFLYYLYGGEISDEDFVEHSKDLIHISDKYGVTNLKLESEVWYVHSTKITMENVIDNLLYADATNCALLKEVLMDFIVKNKEEVMQRVSFDDVPGHVCKDLLAAVARRDNDVARDDNGVESGVQMNFSKMRIGELREKLDEKGLCIDGSREALVAKYFDGEFLTPHLNRFVTLTSSKSIFGLSQTWT